MVASIVVATWSNLPSGFCRLLEWVARAYHPSGPIHTARIVNGRNCASNPFVVAVIVCPSPY